MADLFDIYPEALSKTPQKESVDLLELYNPLNKPGTPEEALDLSKKQIKEQYPNMPDWLRNAILSLSPKDNSPMLESAARGISNVTDYIPAAAGGLLQGASLPIRGVASTIPTEFTQQLANSPDLTNYFAQPTGQGQKAVQDTSEFFGALGPLGKMFAGLKAGTQTAKVPKALQNAIALGGTGYLGTLGDTTEKLIGSGEALALGGAGKVASKAGAKIAPFMRGLFNESTPNALIESVQKPHDILDKAAEELYGQTRQAINKRGIKTPISEQLIEQAAEHFPKNTRSYKKLLQEAKEGNYEAIHKIQSSLFKKGTKALSSEDLAQENQGEDILDLRDKINNELEKYLIQSGNLDIAHVLRQGKKIFSELRNTYYDKLLPKGIGKLVHPETRLIPENAENLFKQNSVPVKRFLEKHPETSKHIKGLNEKKEAMKALNKILVGSGVAGGLVTGGKVISDLFH
jgi:hypothetical protein